MDYEALALEFMQKMYILNRERAQKQFNESMQGESFVLQFLAHQEDAVLPSEISNFMGISTARIAVTLNNLERKGMITRRIDTSDRRKILVNLTSEGRTIAQEQQQAILDSITKMITLLGEHDAREYVRITGRMAEFASQYKDIR